MTLNANDILRDNMGVIEAAFGTDLLVRNFVEPSGASGVDDYLDPNGSGPDGTTDEHPSNPVSTVGEVSPFFGESMGRPRGVDVDVDVMIFLPEDIDVVGPDGGTASDGAELVKATEVERVKDGAKFAVSHVFDMDNGRVKAFGRRL